MGERLSHSPLESRHKKSGAPRSHPGEGRGGWSLGDISRWLGDDGRLKSPQTACGAPSMSGLIGTFKQRTGGPLVTWAAVGGAFWGPTTSVTPSDLYSWFHFQVKVRKCDKSKYRVCFKLPDTDANVASGSLDSQLISLHLSLHSHAHRCKHSHYIHINRVQKKAIMPTHKKIKRRHAHTRSDVHNGGGTGKRTNRCERRVRHII